MNNYQDDANKFNLMKDNLKKILKNTMSEDYKNKNNLTISIDQINILRKKIGMYPLDKLEDINLDQVNMLRKEMGMPLLNKLEEAYDELKQFADEKNIK